MGAYPTFSLSLSLSVCLSLYPEIEITQRIELAPFSLLEIDDILTFCKQVNEYWILYKWSQSSSNVLELKRNEVLSYISADFSATLVATIRNDIIRNVII